MCSCTIETSKRESTHKPDTMSYHSYKRIKHTKVSCYTFTCALRGVVSSVGRSSRDLFLVEPFSRESVCLINLSLVTNHPMMVRIAEGKKEAINPPT